MMAIYSHTPWAVTCAWECTLACHTPQQPASLVFPGSFLSVVCHHTNQHVPWWACLRADDPAGLNYCKLCSSPLTTCCPGASSSDQCTSGTRWAAELHCCLKPSATQL